jgi:hypothetical protein
MEDALRNFWYPAEFSKVRVGVVHAWQACNYNILSLVACMCMFPAGQEGYGWVDGYALHGMRLRLYGTCGVCSMFCQAEAGMWVETAQLSDSRHVRSSSPGGVEGLRSGWVDDARQHGVEASEYMAQQQGLCRRGMQGAQEQGGGHAGTMLWVFKSQMGPPPAGA